MSVKIGRRNAYTIIHEKERGKKWENEFVEWTDLIFRDGERCVEEKRKKIEKKKLLNNKEEIRIL